MTDSRVPFVCLAVLLATAASGDAQPARLESVDPLTRPAPFLARDLALPAELATPR